MKTSRTFSFSDVDMLTAAASIVENAMSESTFLSEKRSTWADPFFPNMRTRITNAFTNILGISNPSKLKQVTMQVESIRADSLNALSDLKTQLSVDFADKKTELNLMLTEMGIAQSGLKDCRNSQQILSQALQKVKKTLTPELQEVIVAKGTSQKLIDKLLEYADQFPALNIEQEAVKARSKTITQESVIELNSIYSDTIGVCKIARALHRGNKAAQEKYSFAKIIKALSSIRKSESGKPKEEENSATQPEQ